MIRRVRVTDPAALEIAREYPSTLPYRVAFWDRAGKSYIFSSSHRYLHDAVYDARGTAARTGRSLIGYPGGSVYEYLYTPPQPIVCRGRSLTELINMLPAPGCRCIECTQLRNR